MTTTSVSANINGKENKQGKQLSTLSKEYRNDKEEDLTGLTQVEADFLLQKYGPNAIPEQKVRPWLIFLQKMWAPVPWMLEASIILEIILGKYPEAVIIGALVIFNALMSTFQEHRAQNALALLRKRLSITSRVLRDDQWQMLPADRLVPGDLVYLRMGDIVPADIKLVSGTLLLDQSSLTGESMPVEAEKSAGVYAGTTVRRGEARGHVIATGTRTKFGNTAELVRLAKSTGQLERIVFSIAKNLVLIDAVLVILVLLDAILTRLPLSDILPFALILLVASVPVALPATFTVATALGALELAKNGVLVTRLSAIEEAASMEVLCSDKTGTLTENHLVVAAVKAFPPYSEADVIRLATMASDAATQDPLDMAILEKARTMEMGLDTYDGRTKFIPFDPTTKRSEAFFNENGHVLHVMKGAPQVISTFDARVDGTYRQTVAALAEQGLRVLSVASGVDQSIQVAGLIALQDPPRSDSATLIARLKDLGVRLIMITGDSLETARSIALKIGIGGPVGLVCRGENLKGQDKNVDPNCGIYAEVLPDEKYNLVKKLQSSNLVVGMTGDGVNDAPALKQAEVGIAVSNATDVAKAAASLVLTAPGLSNLVTAIETSRRIYQRMLTYTLNKIIKTIEIAFFLSFGLIFARTFVTSPLLMVLLLFTNDFVTMTIATDHVEPSRLPNRWNIRSIVLGAVGLALPILALSFAIFWYAHSILQLPLRELQTLLFVMLVYSGQGTIYLIRERRHFWASAPSRWMLIGSILDILIVGFLATQGILMTPVPLVLVAELLFVILTYLTLLDFAKVIIFRRLNLH